MRCNDDCGLKNSTMSFFRLFQLEVQLKKPATILVPKFHRTKLVSRWITPLLQVQCLESEENIWLVLLVSHTDRTMCDDDAGYDYKNGWQSPFICMADLSTLVQAWGRSMAKGMSPYLWWCRIKEVQTFILTTEPNQYADIWLINVI